GDIVLKESVKRMTEILRTYDTLGRYGGEEFLVILPGCAEGAALSVAERIRDQIEKTKFPKAGQDITVTASIGVAVSKAGGLDYHLLIELADQALYRAKAGGRNRVESAPGLAEDSSSPLTADEIAERLQIEIAYRKQMQESLRKAEERF